MTNTNTALAIDPNTCTECEGWGWLELVNGQTMGCFACDSSTPWRASGPSHNVSRRGLVLATTTRVEFVWKGMQFVAIRFERSDTGCRGIELYTIDDDNMENFLRYEGRKSSLDSTARQLIANAMPKDESCERFSLLEMI